MDDIKVLVVDDEKIYRYEISEFLTDINCISYSADSPSSAMEILNKEDIDLMILDIKLPEMDGIEFLKKIKKEYPDIEVIMVTGHGDMDLVIEALRAGAIDFLNKPFGTIQIQSALERSKKFINLTNKLNRLEANFAAVNRKLENQFGHKIVGKSKSMKQVFDLMNRVAQTDDTSVLIIGETGTGKELVARGIHHLSSRKKEYFYDVNCSAVPESLFESEFFGHKKGAFTGAIENKVGWFEMANNGTLFLDEIGDMPHSQQIKLLRVLEDRKVRRIGSHRDIPVNVRIIAATNKDLRKLVEEKKFREDLYHRLAIFTIYLEPLRNRKEDIPVLLEYFAKKIAKKMKKNITKIDKDVFEYLRNYKFPGNVRELRNMVERAIIMCDDEVLRLNHFSTGFKGNQEPTSEIFDLELLEKQTIIKAMKLKKSKAEVARLLNITHQSLNRRLKKYNLE